MSNHDEYDPELHGEYVDPSPAATAAVMVAAFVVFALALYGLADILGKIYAWTAA